MYTGGKYTSFTQKKLSIFPFRVTLFIYRKNQQDNWVNYHLGRADHHEADPAQSTVMSSVVPKVEQSLPSLLFNLIVEVL